MNNSSNLIINRSTTDYVGIFGQNRGDISTMKIFDSNFIGQRYTGGIVGYNYGSIYYSKNYYLNVNGICQCNTTLSHHVSFGCLEKCLNGYVFIQAL
jgi:hypothetical protein